LSLGWAALLIAGQSNVPAASRRLPVILVGALCAALAGCGLPGAAPTSLELTAPSTSELGFDYALVNINAGVVAKLDQFHPSFGEGFVGARAVASNALQAGDVIGITVYESGGATLFPPPSVVAGAAAAPARIGDVATGASNIPPQVIEADGTIFVPYVGRVHAQGLTPGQAGALIQRNLEGKAVSPQVLVSLVNNIGNAVTVGGEVNTPRPVPLSSRGERLLDVIAAAGGAKYPAYESYVQVVRNGRVGKILLQTVVNNPRENIIIRSRDQIYLSHNPRTFAVLGASLRVASYPFAYEKVTLTEAIAQAGGPIDMVGDPSGIYLFRFEPWFIAKDVVDAAYIANIGAAPPEFVPVLYHINLRDAQSYFLTKSIQMRDKDVVLVTDAESTQVLKLLAVVRGFTGIAYDLKRSSTP